MTGTPGEDDPATLAAAGVLAATLATLTHETLGHGGACLAEGRELLLLTSMLAQCRDGSPWVDVTGSATLLAVGAAALAGAPRFGGAGRLLLTLLGGFCLYWLAGMTLYSGVTGAEDLGFAARGWGWPPAWRVGAAVAALALYGLTGAVLIRRLRAVGGRIRRRVGTAWAAGTASAVAAGLMWAADPVKGAVFGFVTFAVFPVPLAWAAGRAAGAGEGEPIGRSWPWIAAALAGFAAFALVQGRGIGRLA